MTAPPATETPPVDLHTHPDRYRHIRLAVDGAVARLTLDIDENQPFREGYVLKLNSYDLGVDLEIADAVERIRFEHPEVKVMVLESAKDRVFCAGANIKMLGLSEHGFKINFCKFTNETRLGMEDASVNGGIRFLAALNGVTAGGGYELALACDEIVLIDDGSSAVSLPEVPLLGVLPGTGGLTRVVDKRKVRRDRADIFCTVAEGIRGKRAVEWNLVDALAPRSRFEATVAERAAKLAAGAAERSGPGVELTEVTFTEEGGTRVYEYVTLACDSDHRTATLTVRGPGTGASRAEAAADASTARSDASADASTSRSDAPADAGSSRGPDLPATPEAFRALGASAWAFRVFREIDDALLHLRFNEPECGVLLLKTEGDPAAVLASDRFLAAHRDDWFVNEVLLYQARVLRRLDLTARSVFALVEPGSCFAGGLFELALAADRSYVLEDGDEPAVALSPLNLEAWPMTHGPSRLAVRFHGDPEQRATLNTETPYPPAAAEEAGLITVALDDIDYEDEVRVAVEERASMSPDALTGMEASLRFPGAENCDSKIFGRLSAWQNWIFYRPNAVGEKGALKVYGRPERPDFDWRRT